MILRRLGALLSQLLSFATTASAVVFVMQPHDEAGWALALGVAVVIEIIFALMKETLFHNLAHPAGWIGLVLDGAVNTGGMLPWAGKLLTFGPILLILGVFRVDVSDPVVSMVGGATISAVFGFILSIVPHWLWRSPRAPKREQK